MPPVAVVRRAARPRRDHRRAERMLRRALAPNAGHSRRLLTPCRISPAMHIAATPRLRCRPDVEAPLGVEARVRPRRRSPLAGIMPMPRHSRSPSSNTSLDDAPAPRRLPSRSTDARVGVLHLGAARLELPHRREDALRAGPPARSPVTTIGTPNCVGDRAILPVAHDRAHVAGRQERLHPVVRRCRGSRASPAARSTCETSTEKFVEPQPLSPGPRSSRWPARSSRSRWRRRPPRGRGSRARADARRAASRRRARRRPRGAHGEQVAVRSPARAACRRS